MIIKVSRTTMMILTAGFGKACNDMGAIEQAGCYHYAAGEWTRQTSSVVREAALTIYLNQKELVTILCTPVNINYFVLGFLYSEGIIEDIKEIASMRVCDDELEVDVRLNHAVDLPQSRTLTSGCGGGAMLGQREMDGLRVRSEVVMTPAQVTALMKQLLDAARTHNEVGGLHTAALGDGDSLVAIAEDIGRHNTLDKLKGECLLRRLPTQDRPLVSTGRISSEMLFKAARMGVPVVISRSAITGRAISLAEELGIAAIGYTRGDRFTVYSHPERVLLESNSLAGCQGR